ncbi:hypothetical protein [Microbacterium aurum]
MPDHYVQVRYQCRSGYEWNLIATLKQQVHPALRATPPSGVAGSRGLPAGACPPPSAEELAARVTAELHSNRHPDHIKRGFVLLQD